MAHGKWIRVLTYAASHLQYSTWVTAMSNAVSPVRDSRRYRRRGTSSWSIVPTRCSIYCRISSSRPIANAIPGQLRGSLKLFLTIRRLHGSAYRTDILVIELKEIRDLRRAREGPVKCSHDVIVPG